MARTLAELLVKLGANTAEYETKMKGAKKRAKIFGTDIQKIGKLASGAFTVAAAGVGIFATAMASSVRELDDYNLKLKQTEALLNTTNNASGLTAGEISKLADEIGRSTLASEKDVLSAANSLLTFKSIGGDVFKETLSLAQDLASLGFGSIQSASVQLAKALEDPAINLSNLRRVGVSFSQQQIELIKSLDASGQKMKAQGIIIQALRDQVGGAAGAQASGTLAGATDSLGQSWRELKRNFAEGRGFQTAVGFVELLDDKVKGLADRIGNSLEFQLKQLDDEIARREAKLQERQDNKFLAGRSDADSVNAAIQRQIADREREKFTLQQLQGKELANQLGQETLAKEAREEYLLIQEQQRKEQLKLNKAKQIEAEREKQLLTAEQRRGEERTQGIEARFNRDLEKARTLTRSVKSETEILNGELAEVRDLYDRGFISESVHDKHIARIIEQREVLGTIPEEVEAIQERMKNLGDTGNSIWQELTDGGQLFKDSFTGFIAEAIDEGDLKLNNFLKSIKRRFIELFVRKQLTDPLFDFLGEKFPSFFGGADGRAGGGRVKAGTLYKINEKGGEGFVPDSNGTIIPTNRMNQLASGGGAAPIQLRVHVDNKAGEVQANAETQVSGGNQIDVFVELEKKMAASLRQGQLSSALLTSYNVNRRIS